MYKELQICGLRGFSKKQILYLAVPTGAEGSGLTIVVGANNSGKSTIWEAFRALTTKRSVFSLGKRNIEAGDKVRIEIFDTENKSTFVETVEQGGSVTRFQSPTESGVGQWGILIKCFTVPSRRGFNPTFSDQSMNRDNFIQEAMKFEVARQQTNSSFSCRLVEINHSLTTREKYNSELKQVLGFCPEWTIDTDEQNSSFLKLKKGRTYHNSDGAGEGLLSIFTIVDSLYDSKEGDFIVIDEPELSLHPALQRRLFAYIQKKAKDRQIVIFTHSPFFIGWEALMYGAELSRVVSDETEGSLIYRLSADSKEKIKGLLTDRNNPHILGLEATECFFLDDNIILTEGQDDVCYYREYFEKHNLCSNSSFYGFGVGGACKMEIITSFLQDLHYKKVFGILDNDKIEIADDLKMKFPQYRFVAIPAKDVKDKKAREASAAVEGLFSNGEVKSQYQVEFSRITDEMSDYFGSKEVA